MEDDIEEQKHSCVICGEELNQDTILENPYGYLCEINQSKLFYHSKRHTFEKMQERYQQQISNFKIEFGNLRN